MDLTPLTLEGKHVRLEPLNPAHEQALVSAAADGELWHSKVTTVPSESTAAAYIAAALGDQSRGLALPFVIISKALNTIVGSTRFLHIASAHRRVEIGNTWLSASAQRTAINTEAKLLLLTHAFEQWQCIRVELVTDVLNTVSRAAIVRLGAREEGVFRSHMLMPDGRHRDSVFHGIIASDWPAIKRQLCARLARANGE